MAPRPSTRPNVFHQRKHIPLARSILWMPRALDDDGRALGEPAVFITQGALREVMRHLRSTPDEELLGFLLGERYEDPETRRRFLFINSTIRTGHIIAEQEPVQIPDAEWLGLQLEVRRRRTSLLGWYHSPPFVAPTPFKLDVDTHCTRFTDEVQVGLLIATSGDVPTGGLFRAFTDVNDDPHSAYIPFYETLEDDAAHLEGGIKRTLIDWSNYATTERVERDTSERRSMPVGVSRTSESATQSSLPVVIPSTLTPTSMERASRDGSGRRRVAAIVATAFLIVGTIAGAIWWYARPIPEPPPSVSSVLIPHTAEAPAATGVPAGAPATTSAPPDITSGARDAATPAPSPVIVAPVLPAVSPSDTMALRFDRLADSLRVAIRNFHDRRDDFSAKRITCGELAVGYGAADDALIALSATYRTARATLDSVRLARYDKLSADIDGVNRDFDESKCPRP